MFSFHVRVLSIQRHRSFTTPPHQRGAVIGSVGNIYMAENDILKMNSTSTRNLLARSAGNSLIATQHTVTFHRALALNNQPTRFLFHLCLYLLHISLILPPLDDRVDTETQGARRASDPALCLSVSFFVHAYQLPRPTPLTASMLAWGQCCICGLYSADATRVRWCSRLGDGCRMITPLPPGTSMLRYRCMKAFECLNSRLVVGESSG